MTALPRDADVPRVGLEKGLRSESRLPLIFAHGVPHSLPTVAQVTCMCCHINRQGFPDPRTALAAA